MVDRILSHSCSRIRRNTDGSRRAECFGKLQGRLHKQKIDATLQHRDLHWGQILVKSVPIKKTPIRGCRFSMDNTRFGVKTTIIDLGLSRMDANNSEDQRTYWTSFDDDIFEGEGDYQYDVYRMTRKLNGGAWDRYQPFTNVMVSSL